MNCNIILQVPYTSNVLVFQVKMKKTFFLVVMYKINAEEPWRFHKNNSCFYFYYKSFQYSQVFSVTATVIDWWNDAIRFRLQWINLVCKFSSKKTREFNSSQRKRCFSRAECCKIFIRHKNLLARTWIDGRIIVYAFFYYSTNKQNLCGKIASVFCWLGS